MIAANAGMLQAHKGCLAGMQAARSILERTGKGQAGVQLLSPCSAC